MHLATMCYIIVVHTRKRMDNTIFMKHKDELKISTVNSHMILLSHDIHFNNLPEHNKTIPIYLIAFVRTH